MNTLNKVKKLVNELNTPENRQKIMNERQLRLKNLIDDYGVDVVAIAGGYAVSTLVQYIRVKNPSNIGEESVSQAEYILGKL